MQPENIRTLNRQLGFKWKIDTFERDDMMAEARELILAAIDSGLKIKEVAAILEVKPEKVSHWRRVNPKCHMSEYTFEKVKDRLSIYMGGKNI